jgi:outer membrane murein-binding lipoprotein Lpp
MTSTRWTWAQVEDIELATEPVSTETPMEARMARLEADVAHLRSDVARVEEDVRSLRDRMEAKFDAVTAALAGLKDSIAGTKSELSAAIGSAKIWAVMLYLALAAGMFGTMARGFGWI